MEVPRGPWQEVGIGHAWKTLTGTRKESFLTSALSLILDRPFFPGLLASSCGTMFVLVLYYGLGSMTATCVSRLFVYQFPLCPHCVRKIHRWRITQSIRNFWWGDLLEQVTWLLATKRQEQNQIHREKTLVSHQGWGRC